MKKCSFFVCNKLLLLLFLLLVFTCLWSCKSNYVVKSNRDSIEVNAQLTTDTLLITADEDAYWYLSSDRPWLIFDSTVKAGNQSIPVIILENTDSAQREAILTIKGDRVTPTVIKIKQHFGQGGDKQTTDEPKKTTPKPKKKPSVEQVVVKSTPKPIQKVKRIKTQAPREEKVVQEEIVEQPTEPVKPVEKEKPVIKINADEVNIGALANVESQEVNLSSNTKWKVVGVPQNWLKVVNENNEPTTKGENAGKLKFVTTANNMQLKPRTVSIKIVSEADSTVFKTILIKQQESQAKLALRQDTVNVSFEAGAKQTFSIKAYQTNWTIESTAEWLKIDPTEGTPDDTTATITVEANPSPEARETTINIVSTGGIISKELKIKQSPKPTELIVGTITGDLDTLRGSFKTFSVRSTENWTITKPDNTDWISIDVLEGAASDAVTTITVTAEADNPDTTKSVTLNIVSGNTTKSILVKQLGALSLKKAQEEIAAASTETTTSSQSGSKSNNKDQDAAKAFADSQNDIMELEKNIEPKIAVSKLPIGEFYPYIALGNPSLYRQNDATTPVSYSFNVESSVSFILTAATSTDDKFNIEEILDTSFYKVEVDDAPYLIGKILSKGSHTIKITAKKDNVNKLKKSLITFLTMKRANGTNVSFKVINTDGAEQEYERIELKLEAYPDINKYIQITNLKFNGYNSVISLGKQKRSSDDVAILPTSVTIEVNSEYPFRFVTEEGMGDFSTLQMLYATSGKASNKYDIKDKMQPGQYNFTITAKKAFKDKNKTGQPNTVVLRLEVLNSETKNFTNSTILDMSNFDLEGSRFREEFLIEQESE